MIRIALATVLGLLLLGAGSAPAHAHADFRSATPANGATVPRAPATIELRFNEPVEVDTLTLLDRTAAPVPASVTEQGSRLTVTPRTPLTAGFYAVTWAVASGDGHTVAGTTTFAVGPPRVASTPMAVTTKPVLKATLSANAPGALVLRTAKAIQGEVGWNHPALLGPLVWSFEGRDAAGILPFPGTWGLEVTQQRQGAVVVNRGTVILR